MADYQEKVVALDAALERQPIIGAGTPVDSVYVNQALPVGLTLKVHAGNRAGIVLSDFAAMELCPAETEGVFVTTTPALPGQVLSLIVGTGLRVDGGV